MKGEGNGMHHFQEKNIYFDLCLETGMFQVEACPLVMDKKEENVGQCCV